MVTPVQTSNTIAFPTQKRSSNRKRPAQSNDYTALRLQLSNVLQTSLELSQVLQLFFDEVQHSLPLGSLSYSNEKLNNRIDLGQSARHSCHYKLISNQNSLGELTFTRHKRFSNKELELLETLIGSLICPIRNALLYRDAIQSALKDSLTGSGNRLALENTLEREVALAHRHQHPLSVLIADIDKFKAINDSYGPAAGDFVLKDVARLLTQCSRDTDSTYRTYRFGGEEFVILLSNTGSDGAQLVGERIRRCIENMTTTYEDNSINVTVSVGVATLGKSDDMSSLFSKADKALYQAKSNGRNQVVKAL